VIPYSPPRPIDRLPLIELGDARARGSRDAPAVAAAVRDACTSVGFFYLAGHGIPQALLDGQLDWTRRFFALPLPDRERIAMRNSRARRGFEPIATQVLDAGTPPDLKESFYLGRELGPDHPYVRAGLAGYGANQWPGGIPGFREQMETYLVALGALAVDMMRVLALSLELVRDYFDPMMREPMPVLRLIHYPPHPADARTNQLGAGAHTDWGALTFLLQDDSGGLEVQNVAGDWVAAPPVPGTFVVNLGDMIERWTNGLYRSTLHRVLNRARARSRYSVPYFSNPDFNARVECLPTCTDAARPPRSVPCTAGEHLKESFELSYARGKQALRSA
jgi:isopenicillin N synthase-like dioxygenase